MMTSRLIEMTTTTIIVVGLLVILSGCNGHRFNKYDHPLCDAAVKLCQ